MSSRKATIWIVVVLVLLLYVVSVGWAVYLTMKPTPAPGDMPGFLLYVASSVDAILVANLGLILGVQTLRRSGKLVSFEEPDPTEDAQALAAWVYVVVVVAVFVVWFLKGFSEEPSQIVPLLTQMPRGGIGLLLAAVAGILGVKKP